MTMNKFSQFLLLAVLVSSVAPLAHAGSLEVDGPGFKVQNKTGWFGTGGTSYTDALGNNVSRSKGLFGRTTTKTKILGAETYKRGQNVSVTGADGTPLITTHRGLFGIGGRTTHIDGNNIIRSFKGVFNSNSAPISQPTQ
jgi:hypothetical protein